MATSLALGGGALALGGCGSGSSARSASATGSASSAGPMRAPGTAPAGSVRVIRAWSQALLRGDIIAAARYFALPSIFYIGSGPPLRLSTRRDAVAANEALTCGARVLSAHGDGPYVNVLFRLVRRAGPGGGAACGTGVGATARTNFLIRGGLIVQWVRAPDEPGNGGSAPPPSTTTTATGPVV